MTRHDLSRRLDTLEARYRPADLATLSDDERRWFAALCASPWHDVVEQFARILAERRHWHAVGVAAPWHGDWRATVAPADREAATDAEVSRLTQLMDDEPGRPFADVLDAWAGVADREGWPPLGGVTFTLDAAGFAAMVERGRHALDQSRGCDMPGAIAWRSHVPQWRPGLDGDDALAVDVQVLRAANALGVAR